MSRETWEPEVRRCRNCGRQFGMLHPTRWAYKRPKGARYEYFCSWGCLRADEKKDERKEEKEVKTQDKTQRTRMNTKDMEKAVEMLKNGDKALDQFLKNHGITNIYKWKYNIRTRHGIQKPEEPDVELIYDPDIENVYREEQAEIGMREERGRRIAEGLDRADQMRKQMIDGIQPLPVAAVYSRTIDGARFRKTDSGMMLVNSDYFIELTAYEWYKLTEEILMAIRQLDATKPEMDN